MEKRTRKKQKKYRLSGKNAVVAVRLLEDVIESFDKHGVRYWLDFGTLLGIVRENRLLPWDTDMDMSIFAQDREKVRDIVLPEINAKHYRTYTRLFKKEDAILAKGDIQAFRVRNYRWKLLRGLVKIDIFVMYQHQDYYYWYELGAKHRLPVSLLSDFSTVEFNGKTYSKPSDHDAYLTHHYGDWRTPNPHFHARYDNFRTRADS